MGGSHFDNEHFSLFMTFYRLNDQSIEKIMGGLTDSDKRCQLQPCEDCVKDNQFQAGKIPQQSDDNTGISGSHSKRPGARGELKVSCLMNKADSPPTTPLILRVHLTQWHPI